MTGLPPLDAMLAVIATSARVVICAGICHYEASDGPVGRGQFASAALGDDGGIIFDHADR